MQETKLLLEQEEKLLVKVDDVDSDLEREYERGIPKNVLWLFASVFRKSITANQELKFNLRFYFSVYVDQFNSKFPDQNSCS